MSMTKVDARRKEIIIDAMCRTAANNGKLDEKLHMTWIAGRLHRIEVTLIIRIFKNFLEFNYLIRNFLFIIKCRY